MTERLNIRRMQVLESAETERTFDLEKDITSKDWEAIERYRDGLVPRNESTLEHDKATRLQLDLGILGRKIYFPGKGYEEIHMLHMMAPISNEWSALLRGAVLLRMTKGKEDKISDDEWEKIEKHLDAIRTGQLISHVEEIAALAHIVEPGRLTLADTDKRMRDGIIESGRNRGLNEGFTEIVASERILGRSIALTPEDWKQMRHALDARRKMKHWELFTHLAAQLAVIAAERIDTADGQLRITMRKLDDKIPAQPETLEV